MWQSCHLSTGLRFHSQASGVPRRECHCPSLINNCVHPFLTALLCHPSIQQMLLEQQWPGIGWDREVVDELCHSPCHQGDFSLLVKQSTDRRQECSPYTFKRRFIDPILFLAVLGLNCCTQAFSSYAEWGYAF